MEPLRFCEEGHFDVDVGISRWMYSNPVNLRFNVDDETGVALRLVAVQVLDLVHPRESQEDTFEKVEGGFSTDEPASAEPPQSADSSPQPSDASQF